MWNTNLALNGCHKPLCKLEKVSFWDMHPGTHGLVSKTRMEFQSSLTFLGTNSTIVPGSLAPTLRDDKSSLRYW